MLSQAYQEYISTYKKLSSLYIIEKCENIINLYIYDTESETEEAKVLDITENLFFPSYIIQLPNNEIFFTCQFKHSTFSFIIDKNYRIRKLPLGLPAYCFTLAYVNKSVYCFGGWSKILSPSRRFDLDENRWREIASMEENYYSNWSSYTNYCSIIFNGNILISRHNDCNILLYSLDIDSFSKIPQNFKVEEYKLLISAKERIYLIELRRFIYESEVGDEYAWKPIGNSNLQFDNWKATYCAYNKGGIYISIHADDWRGYFKFDLVQKCLIEIACYGKYLALKRLGDNLETIDCYEHTFKLDPEHAATYINNRFPLFYLCCWLGKIEECDQKIKIKPGKTAYKNKGDALYYLRRYLEAIECYNDAIKLAKCYADAYDGKGNALKSLDRNLEAVECYNEAIKLQRHNPRFYRNRAEALDKLATERGSSRRK